MTSEFKEGEKVRHSNGRTYDFGYYSPNPKRCVVYNEGESNMQDSFVVHIKELERVSAPTQGNDIPHSAEVCPFCLQSCLQKLSPFQPCGYHASARKGAK